MFEYLDLIKSKT